MKKNIRIATTLACLSSTLPFSFQALAQCLVADRYGGVTTIAGNQKIPNLAGMIFPGRTVCHWNKNSETDDCMTEPGGPLDDKINRVSIPQGCKLLVAEHPGFEGNAHLFPPGDFNDIQWHSVNDISSVLCDCPVVGGSEGWAGEVVNPIKVNWK